MHTTTLDSANMPVSHAANGAACARIVSRHVKGVSPYFAGSQSEEQGLDSPLATTRVYPDRGRGTFSPPDTLRDSMALFLQVSKVRPRACTCPPERWP